MKELDQVVGQVPPGEVESLDRVREREAFVDGNNVGDAVARVEDDAGGSTGGVERENGLREKRPDRALSADEEQGG